MSRVGCKRSNMIRSLMLLSLVSCIALCAAAGGVDDPMVVNATVEVIHVPEPEIAALPQQAMIEAVYIDSAHPEEGVPLTDRLPDSEDMDPLALRVENVESEMKAVDAGLEVHVYEHGTMSKEIDSLTLRIKATEDDARSTWVDERTAHEDISNEMETLVQRIEAVDVRLRDMETNKHASADKGAEHHIAAIDARLRDLETLVHQVDEMSARLTEIEVELKARPQQLPVVGLEVAA